mgnify:FL=1
MKFGIKAKIKLLSECIIQGNIVFFIVYFAGIILSGMAPVIQLNIIQRLMEILEFSLKSGYSDKLLIQGGTLIILEVVIFLFLTMVDDIRNILNELMALKTNNNIQKKIIDKFEKLSLSNFDNSDFYDIYENTITKTEPAFKQIVNTISLIASLLITFVGYVTVIGKFNIFAILITILPMIPSVLVQFKIEDKRLEFIYKETITGRKKNYFYSVLTKPEYAKEIKIFNSSNFFKNKRQYSFYEFYRKKRQLSKNEFIKMSISSFIGKIGVIITMFWVFLEMVRGKYNISNFTSTFLAITSLETTFVNIVNLLSLNYNCLLSLDYILKFFEANETYKKHDKKLSKNNAFHCLEFQNVWFKYPNSSNYSLKNINFKLSRGEKILMIGENGSGKSTIIKLLLRFYEPTEGKILVNGINITEFSDYELYSFYTAIFQDYNKYSISLKENILLGDRENSQRLKGVLKNSQADGFVHNLKHGLDTNLTKIFDPDGIELSTGQMQKIAIARALYKTAPVLIMDEPTASVDGKSERELYELLKILDDRAVLCISHQPYMVESANEIILLNQGSIVVKGTHKELLNKSKEYKLFFDKNFGNDQTLNKKE